MYKLRQRQWRMVALINLFAGIVVITVAYGSTNPGMAMPSAASANARLVRKADQPDQIQPKEQQGIEAISLLAEMNGEDRLRQPAATATPDPAEAPDGPALFRIHHKEGQPVNKIYTIVIVPDREFGDLQNDKPKLVAFRLLVNPLVDKGMFFNSAIARNWEWFSVWFTSEPAEVTNNGGDCPKVELSSRTLALGNGVVLVPNLIVVVHKEAGVDDCTWHQNPTLITLRMKQPATGELEKNAPRIMVHELGHAFGLPDEYTGAPTYCAVAPLLYTTKETCEDDETNVGWRGGAECQELIPRGGGASYWRSEQHIDIMGAEGDTVLEFGPGDWQIIRKFYLRLATGTTMPQSCLVETRAENPQGAAAGAAEATPEETSVDIEEPDTFAPDDWFPSL